MISQAAYQAALEGAGEAGAGVATISVAPSPADTRAAREAGGVHDGGDFIDSLTPTGPRSQP